MTKSLFFVSPIGSDTSEVRERSNVVKKRLIIPVATEKGYECIRADEIPDPGRIDDQVIRACIESDLVIADLTGHNPNVFYEIAVRHAKAKPMIFIAKKGTDIPFDIKTQRTIFYDEKDVETFFQAQEQIRAQIDSVSHETWVPDSPIKEALIDSRGESSTNETQEILQIVRNNSEILQAITRVSSRREEEFLFRNRELEMQLKEYKERIEFLEIRSKMLEQFVKSEKDMESTLSNNLDEIRIKKIREARLKKDKIN